MAGRHHGRQGCGHGHHLPSAQALVGDAHAGRNRAVVFPCTRSHIAAKPACHPAGPVVFRAGPLRTCPRERDRQHAWDLSDSGRWDMDTPAPLGNAAFARRNPADPSATASQAPCAPRDRDRPKDQRTMRAAAVMMSGIQSIIRDRKFDDQADRSVPKQTPGVRAPGHWTPKQSPPKQGQVDSSAAETALSVATGIPMRQAGSPGPHLGRGDPDEQHRVGGRPVGPPADTRSTPPTRKVGVLFKTEYYTYKGLPEPHGIIRALGEIEGLRSGGAWQNPIPRLIRPLTSLRKSGNEAELSDCVLGSQSFSVSGDQGKPLHITLDLCPSLKAAVQVAPSRYSFSHPPGIEGEYIRSWRLLGSAQSMTPSEMAVLDERDDDAIRGGNLTGSWDLQVPQELKFYKYLRLEMNPKGNSSQTNRMCICCLEVYGQFKTKSSWEHYTNTPKSVGLSLPSNVSSPATPGLSPAARSALSDPGLSPPKFSPTASTPAPVTPVQAQTTTLQKEALPSRSSLSLQSSTTNVVQTSSVGEHEAHHFLPESKLSLTSSSAACSSQQPTTWPSRTAPSTIVTSASARSVAPSDSFPAPDRAISSISAAASPSSLPPAQLGTHAALQQVSSAPSAPFSTSSSAPVLQVSSAPSSGLPLGASFPANVAPVDTSTSKRAGTPAGGGIRIDAPYSRQKGPDSRGILATLETRMNPDALSHMHVVHAEASSLHWGDPRSVFAPSGTQAGFVSRAHQDGKRPYLQVDLGEMHRLNPNYVHFTVLTPTSEQVPAGYQPSQSDNMRFGLQGSLDAVKWTDLRDIVADLTKPYQSKGILGITSTFRFVRLELRSEARRNDQETNSGSLKDSPSVIALRAFDLFGSCRCWHDGPVCVATPPPPPPGTPAARGILPSPMSRGPSQSSPQKGLRGPTHTTDPRAAPVRSPPQPVRTNHMPSAPPPPPGSARAPREQDPRLQP
eukprot:gene7123-1272_t